MRAAVAVAVVPIVLALTSVGARAADAAGATDASHAALPAALPLHRESTATEDHGWKTPFALLLLGGTGAAWAGWRRFARRVRSPETGSALRVVRVSSQALTPQASLHAVQWNGEDLLLACTSQQVSVVARRAAPCAPGREA